MEKTMLAQVFFVPGDGSRIGLGNGTDFQL